MNEYELLWDSFLKTHSNQVGIVKDGPLTPERWEEQNLKVLFYYKETYGYNDTENASISDLYSQWIRDGIRTYKKMAIVSYIIQHGIKNKLVPPFDKATYNSLMSNQDTLINALSNVAVINIGKESIPENQTNPSIIRDKSRLNNRLLRSQLQILNPQIIICGGRVTADSLFCDLGYLSSDQYTMHQVQCIDGKIIAPYYHLSYRYCTYERIFDYCKKIIEAYNKSF